MFVIFSEERQTFAWRLTIIFFFIGKMLICIVQLKLCFKSFLQVKNSYACLNTFFLWTLAKPRTPLHMDGGLDHFFPNSIPLDLAKHGFSIIWRSSKNMNFPKIWRLWLKNCARHAHFNFELLKGVAVLFFEICPWNFYHLWIFYRQRNNVLFIFLYLQQKSWNLRKTPFSSLE